MIAQVLPLHPSAALSHACVAGAAPAGKMGSKEPSAGRGLWGLPERLALAGQPQVRLLGAHDPGHVPCKPQHPRQDPLCQHLLEQALPRAGQTQGVALAAQP